MKIFRPSSTSFGIHNFRLEIGNISNSREATATYSNNVVNETDHKTYSVDRFEYFIDDEAEISVGNTNQRIFFSEKDDAAVLAVEVETPFLRRVWSVKVTG